MTTVPRDQLEPLHPDAMGWALCCCGWQREEAEDVLQTSYLKILDGRARFEGRSSLRTWLFGVILRTAAEERRRRWFRGRKALAATQVELPPKATPEHLAAESAENRALRSALLALPRRQRELLHLVFYQELTVADAARVLGLSVGSARTHYHRGKLNLRARLGGLR